MSDLPRWQCHKQVAADKIVGIHITSDGVTTLHLADGIRITADAELAKKLHVAPGNDLGYYVRYDGDGYESWSPSKAFEDGYTRLP